MDTTQTPSHPPISPTQRPIPSARFIRRRLRPLVAVGAAGALTFGLVACGSDDTSSDVAVTTDGATSVTVPSATESPTATESPSATEATTPADTDTDTDMTMPSATDASDDSTADAPAAAPITNAITITSPGMAYEVSGPLQPGVAAITFHNTDSVAHMMALGRMVPGTTLDQLVDALGQDEDAAGALLADGPDNSVYGTPAPVGPGESTTVTALDLAAGDYGIICFFSDDDGTPHFAMGMVDTFTVEGEQATETPDSDGTISIDDDGTTMPDDFTGSGTYLVTNDGTARHSISFARFDEGTTLDAYYQYVGGQMNSGKAIDGGGGVLVGGVDSLLPGQSAYVTLDLSAGNYGFVSMDDANSPTLPVQSGEFIVS